MKLRLSCADFSFPLLPHGHALELIATLGFEGVDIGLFGGSQQLSPETALTQMPESAHRLLEQAEDVGLAVADVFLIPGSFEVMAANHPDPAERQRSRDLFLCSLEFASLCGSKHISALPGIPWKNEDADSSFARASEELAWRVGRAADVGIKFAVEPHLESIIETPRRTMELLRRTPGLSLTLDYTHFTYQGIPDAQIEPLLAHASHFHARGASKVRLQMPVKLSTIDYAGVVTAMRRHGYRGFVGIEYCWDEWKQCNEVDVLSETILLRNVLREAAAVE
jgi:sugar phosphate isomerase/epimerase